MSLEGKTALVTGAGRGIGKAIALALAKDGANVAVSDIDQGSANQTAEEIKSLGRGSIGLKADVSRSEEVEGMFQAIVDKFGGVDILVNNAGITRDGLLVRMKDEDWSLVMKINLDGAFYCSRAAGKIMMKQRRGAIINIASIVGVMGNAGQVNYSASKAGLIGLTKSSARELASRGVTVNAIAPGFIDTAMTQALNDKVKEKLMEQIPLGRLGSSEDIANAVLFLASPEAAYITGQVLHVNGGMLMA
ncbi:MAG: 3-oxoacyl-[acyl-carrier-protein] reductase [Nitrospinae bacterium]|nr:3-oxoacyl-[acyl-carrier-protein] reductase [Nitrospinota bacterium]